MFTEWYAACSSEVSPSRIFRPFDIGAYLGLEKKYKDEELFKQYKGLDKYLLAIGETPCDGLMTSYLKINQEILDQLNNDIYRDVLPIDFMMHDDTIVDLLTSLENIDYIKEIYRQKKARVKDGLNTTVTNILLDCIRQGRSLLQAGKQADMLAKPLIDFYAASAYAYAIIVINSPLHKTVDTLKGSHGHTYKHSEGTIEFGGSIPSGTFLDLLCALPVIQVNNGEIRFKYSILKSIEFVQSNNLSLSLLTLLSMVPELQSHYQIFDKEHKSVHNLNIKTGVKNNKVTYIFDIGDGISRPNDAAIKRCFNTESIVKVNGRTQISILAERLNDISPVIYQDIYGALWYIESPIENLVLPEICLHFLIISAFCNIMRYSPHEWSNILFNKTSSEFSLLVSRYLRLFEQKFPILAATCLTNYLPIIQKND